MVLACRALCSSTALLTRVDTSPPQPEDGKGFAITALVIGTLQIVVVGVVGNTQPRSLPLSTSTVATLSEELLSKLAVCVLHTGFVTVLFSSVCDAVDQYSDQCNTYNDNNEWLEGCDFSMDTQTQRTCEAAGCAANANTRRPRKARSRPLQRRVRAPRWHCALFCSQVRVGQVPSDRVL